jgi:hypothetical protein
VEKMCPVRLFGRKSVVGFSLRVASPGLAFLSHRGLAQMGEMGRITGRGTSRFWAFFGTNDLNFYEFDCRFSTFSRSWHWLWPCLADLPWARPMDAG